MDQDGSARGRPAELAETPEGTQVLGADGAKLGEVVAVYRDRLIVERGFFFPTDYYVPFAAVADYAGGRIYLTLDRDAALTQGWETPPVDEPRPAPVVPAPPPRPAAARPSPQEPPPVVVAPLVAPPAPMPVTPAVDPIPSPMTVSPTVAPSPTDPAAAATDKDKAGSDQPVQPEQADSPAPPTAAPAEPPAVVVADAPTEPAPATVPPVPAEPAASTAHAALPTAAPPAEAAVPDAASAAAEPASSILRGSTLSRLFPDLVAPASDAEASATGEPNEETVKTATPATTDSAADGEAPKGDGGKER